MAIYHAYECDSCGDLIKAEDRTKVTTRYEGPVVSGEICRDICKACLNPPAQEDLKPLRRRKHREPKTV